MTDKTGYLQMRAGEYYRGPDWYLIELQMAARKQLDVLNAIPSFDMERRSKMLKETLGSFGDSFVVSPVTWEYGTHIHLGEGVLINFDCIFLDGADVRIRRWYGCGAARAVFDRRPSGRSGGASYL